MVDEKTIKNLLLSYNISKWQWKHNLMLFSFGINIRGFLCLGWTMSLLAQRLYLTHDESENRAHCRWAV